MYDLSATPSIQGDDDACLCEDFTDPVPRMERKGWREAHEANQVLAAAANKEYDVVFLGDDTVEMWNGRALNVPANVNPNGRAINQYFNKTFTKAGGGQIEGLALGIYGDSVRTVEEVCAWHDRVVFFACKTCMANVMR